jgi:YggT family protein
MLYFLIRLVDWLASFYYLILFIRVLFSWVNDPFNPVVQFIYRMTEPLLSQIRRILPLRLSMFDFSPIVAFLLIELVKRILIETLIRFA